MRRRGDLGSFTLSPVVAPHVVLAERLKILVNRNDRRAGRIESNCFYLVAGDSRLLHGIARGCGQCSHVIVMRLGRILRIFAFAMQWIFRDCGGEHATLAVHDRHADAESTEINSRDHRHQFVPSGG